MKIPKNTKYLLLIFLISLLLFFPSLFTFYTHDDFFLLKISQAASFKDFIGFFNLAQGPEGLAMYRPLTTQVYYFLAWKLFNLNPIGLHVISYLTFISVGYLVYKIAAKLSESNVVALISAFLYAVSSSHFGHLYYLATYQELGMALFFLLSVFLFIKFNERGDFKSSFLTFIFFVAALASKETAVVLPFILILVYSFLKHQGKKVIGIKNLALFLVPFLTALLAYFYMRIISYGFAQGESYIWDFSPRVLNTLFWYGLWSLNLPEMLVDFVGPGFKFNPNLFKYWAREMIPIFVLFITLLISVFSLVLTSLKSYRKKELFLYLFSFAWFVITLLPVLFLPWHKFTYFLTVPLFGVVFSLAFAIKQSRVPKIAIFTFLAIYISLSVLTLTLTTKTHWITQGSKTARNVYNYLNENIKDENPVKIVFYDTAEDGDLPWSPTKVLKDVLSNNNFFSVFYEGEITPVYLGAEDINGDTEGIRLRARQFLGY